MSDDASNRPNKWTLVGRLFMGVNALDFAVRMCLDGRQVPEWATTRRADGDIVPHCAVSDSRSFADTVRTYNERFTVAHPELAIEASVVATRELLALGRLWPIRPGDASQLVRLDGASADGVTVAAVQPFSIDWLQAQVAAVEGALKRVEIAWKAT